MDKAAVDHSHPFKQVMTYVDRLHEDISKMALLIEQLMEEEGYASEMGSRGSWALANTYNQSTRWRLRYLFRLFAPSDVESTTESIFYLVQLGLNSAFEFPAILCGRATHSALSSENLRSSTVRGFKTSLLTLTHSQPLWLQIGRENGWLIAAEPESDTPLQSVKGYILNLFDMVNRQRVIDNISRPLVNADKSLDEMLTVAKYPFGGIT